MTDLVITGASGFLGSYLLDSLQDTGKKIRSLVRGPHSIRVNYHNTDWVIGDLADRAVWGKLLTPGSTVINLAYSQTSTTEEAIAASRVMSEACHKNSVKRLIHCSTTSVYGRAATGFVNELTPCRPVDDYGKRKLAIEQQLLESAVGYEVVIIRPTSVFGYGGKALVKLCQSLLHKPRLLNYLRSCLFYNRRMHLVPAVTVASAIRFVSEIESSLHKEIFIVSEDHELKNNFHHIERKLLESLEIKDYFMPPIPMPLAILRLLLLAAKKSEIDPKCNFSMSKLRSLGFVPPVGLDAELRRFALVWRGGSMEEK